MTSSQSVLKAFRNDKKSHEKNYNFIDMQKLKMHANRRKLALCSFHLNIRATIKCSTRGYHSECGATVFVRVSISTTRFSIVMCRIENMLTKTSIQKWKSSVYIVVAVAVAAHVYRYNGVKNKWILKSKPAQTCACIDFTSDTNSWNHVT